MQAPAGPLHRFVVHKKIREMGSFNGELRSDFDGDGDVDGIDLPMKRQALSLMKRFTLFKGRTNRENENKRSMFFYRFCNYCNAIQRQGIDGQSRTSHYSKSSGEFGSRQYFRGKRSRSRQHGR